MRARTEKARDRQRAAILRIAKNKKQAMRMVAKQQAAQAAAATAVPAAPDDGTKLN